MQVDVLVIGAGVVGLACGAELARRGREVLVLETNPGPAQEASSRNSEVIHAGLYYPRNSLKALCCEEGRQLLYARCAARRIPHRRTGKLVVASDEPEADALESLRQRGLENGAGELKLLGREQVRRLEPRVTACAAIYSPESGIVDSQQLALSYQAELEEHGGVVSFRTTVVGLDRREGGWSATTRGPGEQRETAQAAFAVNAAGLAADRIAQLAGLDIDALDLRHQPCKGDYFSVAPELGALTQHLVYPVPVPGGLGIHVTLDLGGRFRLGPDVEYVERPSYDVDPEKAVEFARAVGRFLPEIQPHHLTADFAGIRSKLQRQGEPFRDFVIEEASAHGAGRLVNLLGIESPGLTSSAAIARRVADLIG